MDIKQRNFYFLLSALTILSFVSIFFLYSQKSKIAKPQPSLTDKLGFRNLTGKVGYVGIDECRKCHEDQYQSYMKTGMGQSWGHATPAKSVARFSVLFDEKSGYYYKPYWQNGKMMVLEFRLENGDTVYKRTEQVDFVVGSGQHTNSHLAWKNGYLTQVPFTYYTQLGVLDMPPGFEEGHNQRFSRKIGFECISCHNSYPIPVDGSENKYKEIPVGINCERCHGPGELHVNAMKKGHTVDISNQTDYTIVNPRKLPSDLQMELCSRCHSQGNAVLKEGKSFFDFLPGMYVSDVMEVFREKYENDEDAFWMETHPERLKKSACYKASQNMPGHEPITCLTCHFTSTMKHKSWKETPADTFKTICINCHNARDSKKCKTIANQTGDCIKCHMVKTGVFDIPHVIISDHFIRVTGKWQEPIRSTSEIATGKFLGLKSMTSEKPGQLVLARAFMLHYEKFARFPMPELLDSSYKYLKNFSTTQYPQYWIYYHYLKNDYRAVADLASSVKEIKTYGAMTAYQAGQSFYNLGDFENAGKYYLIAVNAEPFNLDYRNKLASTYMAVKDFEKAKQEFEFITTQMPSNAMAWNNLGFIALVEEDFLNAEKYLNLSLKYDPVHLNTHLNLVKLYFGKGEISRGIAYLNRLDGQYPGNPMIREMKKIALQYRNLNPE